MKHIDHFVEDIGCAELLNLSVASLNEHDVTMGIYSENYSDRNRTERDKAAVKNGKTKVEFLFQKSCCFV